MIRILQSLLALIGLLLLALMAARANSAAWQETDPAWQGVPAEPALSPLGRACGRSIAAWFPARNREPIFRASRLPMDTSAARGADDGPLYHRSTNGDWFQWSFDRGD